MSDARISVIIPAYNVAPYVGAALESVLNQTVAPWEILIIDDGSSDKTGAIVAEYADNPRVRFFSQHNQRQGPTRNTGAAQATGDYLYFFDADDLLESHFIETMQRWIEDHDRPDLVMFAGRGFTDDHALDAHVQTFRRRDQASAVSGLDALRLLDADGWLYSAPWLYLVRTAYWRAEDFRFPATFNEDEDIIVPLIVNARSVLIKDEIFIHQRIRHGSTTTQGLNRHHVLALESNLVHAIRDVARVPRSARDAKRLLRNRCRIVAKEYLKLSAELGYPVRKALLVRAAWASGKSKFIKKAFVEDRTRRAS